MIAVLIPSRYPDHLLACLERLALRQERWWRRARLVVADNGLPRTVRREWPQATWVDVSDPFNFARAINLAVRAASGCDYFVLNDDTLMLSNAWLDMLEITMNRHPDGLIAARVSGVVTPASEQGRELHPLEVVESGTMLAFVAVLIPQAIWADVGELDERFSGYGYEDDDYCRRVLAKGYHLYVTGSVHVQHGLSGHTGSSSYRRRYGPEGVRALADEAEEIYRQKWG